MQPSLVDLHTHTTASDGSDSPAAVVRLAVQAKLKAVAITDHDTIAGLDEAEEEGRRLGIEVVRGCEISATCEYGEVHILGLWLPHHCDSLEERLAQLRERRIRRNALMLERLAAIGLPLSMEEVLAYSGGESVGRPHMAMAMLARGYISEINDAYRLYIGRNCPAFVPKESLPPEEAVRMLADAGASVSFAHPMLLRCPAEWREQLTERLASAGLDAIEAYHSEHSAADVRYCVGLAARYGLGLSGGSDYHGVTKPRIQVGRGRGGLRVTVAVMDMLKARRMAKGQSV